MVRKEKSEIEEKKEKGMSEETVLDSVQTEIDLARIELEKLKSEIEEKKKEAERLPVRELSADEKPIFDKQVSRINQNSTLSEKIARQKAYDNEKITGRFMNRRAPGQPIKLPYIKYADDPVKWYPFEDGKIYTIPRGFADQINEYYHTPVFSQKQGPMDPNAPSSQIHEVDTSNKKYAFVPISFAA
jgi:hypothetical protein